MNMHEYAYVPYVNTLYTTSLHWGGNLTSAVNVNTRMAFSGSVLSGRRLSIFTIAAGPPRCMLLLPCLPNHYRLPKLKSI